MEKLIKCGLEIQILVLPSDKGMISWENKIRIIYGNINSFDALNSLTRSCDIVFHLAGKVHSIPGTGKEEDDFFQMNVEGTRNLLNATKKNRVKKVVFYSTVGVYGKNADFHGDEFSPCQPGSVYAESKHLAEQLVLNSYKNGGPNGIVLRFPVAYGPLDRGNVASLIKSIYHRYFFYFGNGNPLKSMISSRNAAEAAIKAAFEPKVANGLFCVTDGQDYRLQEIIEKICQAINTNWRPKHIPISLAKSLGKLGDLFERLTHYSMPINSSKVVKLSRPLTFSCEKAIQVLKYRPIENLYDGITKEVEWLKEINGWK